ncbi:MAG: glycerate kinase [Bacteroidetes bacterium]|nr:glycerate kinase [Bacteroidota bacterium]
MNESQNRDLWASESNFAAKRIFSAAVDGVSAYRLLEQVNNLPISDSCRVVGAGKAAMPMAAALEQCFPNAVFEGEVVVPHGYMDSFPDELARPKAIRISEGGHPIPNVNSQRAAERALKIAKDCGQNDTLIVLLSGGASALWSAPDKGLTLQDIRTVNHMLLQSGADIHQLNTIRKHLSAIKGGRLAVATWPGRVVTLAVSDVIGDDMSVIGSGPTVGDLTTWQDATDIIQALDLRLPTAVHQHLQLGVEGGLPDTPKPNSKLVQQSIFRLLASNADALKAAEATAQNMGYEVVSVDHDVCGEAREVGAAMARCVLRLKPGQCFIWGGETTVTVRGNGKGGRNQELALAAACELEGTSLDAVLLSGGTDGIDGPTDAAGGWVNPDTVPMALAHGVDPQAALEANDAYNCLRATKQLLITGPTHTNVMDVGIGLVAS